MFSTRPKAVVTGLDDLPFCPNCGGLGKVTEDELRFYARMVRLADKNQRASWTSSWSNGCIVGMVGVTVLVVALEWFTNWLR